MEDWSHDESKLLLGEYVSVNESHLYLLDVPLESGSEAYGVKEPVPNLTRVVVQGETASEWLRLDVDPNSVNLFTLERKFLP